MSIKGKACIVGAFEHPVRKAPDKSVAQLHAESARGALLDAGLNKDDIDGYFCAGDAPGLGPLSMVDYMGLNGGTPPRSASLSAELAAAKLARGVPAPRSTHNKSRGSSAATGNH